MALLTESAARAKATEFRAQNIYKSSATVLREAASTTESSFDVFLSHCFKDADLILGVYKLLQSTGLRVYVDWLDDPQLDRSNITPETAELVRNRMAQSNALIYAHSNQSGTSKWMPWELGYFDGFRSAVAVLPIAVTSYESFKGQEYLGLYPYIDGSTAQLFVNRSKAPERLFRGTAAKSLKDWFSEQRLRQR